MVSDIEGLEGLYQIDTSGNVISLRRKSPKKLKPYIAEGYCCVDLSVDRKGNDGRDTRKVHRLVAQAFIPNPEERYAVNHINSNKKDNRLENLEWCTKSENEKHAYQNGKVQWQKQDKHK